MKLEEKAVEIAKRQVLLKLAEEEPWLFAEGGIYHLIKQQSKGKKTFTIHFDEGFVKEVVMHTSERNTYKKPVVR